MPFFHVQNEPYTPASESAELAGNLNLRGEFDGKPFSPSVFGEFEGEILLGGEVNVYSSTEEALDGIIFLRGEIDPEIITKHVFGELNGNLNLSGTLAADVRLSLSETDPILNEISPTAFQSASYFARAYKGASELKIKGFTISAPRNSLGKTVALELATKDPSILDKTASNYKFEIGKASKPYDSPTWTTVIENASLDSRNYSMRWLGDTLSFGAVSPLSDRLNRFPKKNYILFDPNKIQVSTDEIETIFDTNNNAIGTEAIEIAGLTLYQALHRAFVFGSGFSSFETNIPNFEISRCDFTIRNSWMDAIRGFIGVFEPAIFAVGNVLWIIDKTQAMPEDFEPVALEPNRFINWQQNAPSERLIDGFLIQFAESSLNAEYYTEEVETPLPESTGDFGSPNFSETTIVRTWRRWRTIANPDIVLRSELRREIRTTRDQSIVITSRDTEDYSYDLQGKRTETRKVSEKLMPSLPSAELSLQTVRTEIQQFFYKADKFNPRRQVQAKIVTTITGLISVDSDNEYLGEPFRQDFIEAHKAGNLTEGQTLESGAIKTVIETFEQIGNGQLQRRVEGIDHVRNLPITGVPDVVLADNSVNSVGGKLQTVVLFKNGLTPTSRPGNPLENFAVGEVPIIFALPLATRILARRSAKKEQGTIELFGFDESIERGTYFAVKDRDDGVIGNFIVEGFTVTGTDLGTPNQRIITQIEVSEI